MLFKKKVSFRLSEKRIAKLKNYAEQKEKTMTQVIEESIEQLKLENETTG